MYIMLPHNMHMYTCNVSGSLLPAGDRPSCLDFVTSLFKHKTQDSTTTTSNN